jgi:hypothetical protein
VRKRTQALLGSNLTAILTHECTVNYWKEALFRAFLFLIYWYSFMAKKPNPIILFSIAEISNLVFRLFYLNVNYKNNLLSVVPSEEFPHFPVSVFIKGGRILQKAVELQRTKSGHPCEWFL